MTFKEDWKRRGVPFDLLMKITNAHPAISSVDFYGDLGVAQQNWETHIIQWLKVDNRINKEVSDLAVVPSIRCIILSRRLLKASTEVTELLSHFRSNYSLNCLYIISFKFVFQSASISGFECTAASPDAS
jgi:hypothetical protein